MENQNTNRPFLAAMDAFAFLASSELSTLSRAWEQQTIVVWLGGEAGLKAATKTNAKMGNVTLTSGRTGFDSSSR